MAKRTNEQWLVELRDAVAREAALADLRALLLRGLGAALSQRGYRAGADVEDFVQVALLKILDGLDSFRGESQFTTWAQKIAVRVALTEYRRLRWRDTSLEELTERPDSIDGEVAFIPLALADTSAGPDALSVQASVLATMRRVIQERLTEKQRLALIAVRIHGMPLEEVARRMGTNRNALYKLLHDARSRLKRELLAEGLSAEEILEAFDS